MMTMMNFVSHGTQDMYPTFLQKQRGFTPQQAAVIAMIYNVGAILGGLTFGYYSDRVGRRRAMVTALLLGDRRDSALGLRADHDAARHRRVRPAVHGAGRVGRRAGAHQRAVARLGARAFCQASPTSAAS